MFGILSTDMIPHEPIVLITLLVVGMLALVGVGLITYYKKWGILWRDWITTVDHKKIGIMYIVVALVMIVRGFADAVLMRTQLALVASDMGFLNADHFAQIFTAHGVIMIFFVAMPLMFGLFNIAVPLQIGARDVAFPFLNALSFWVFVAGAMLINLSLALGKFATTGWLAYPPLAGAFYSPDVGMDYYIWGIQISGVGSMLSGVNFFTTILKMRAKGMAMFKMPVFTWSVFAASILIMVVFPVLTVTLALLFLDRYFGTHFFTSVAGGDPMLYINMIWVWGHPEVYILVLPAFGVFSEVVATFSKKRLFGYHTMVWAIMVITVLSFLVWVHHFFTMGAGGNVNAVFGIATMLIAIPTGVKVFNWLFTMYRGRIHFSVPMLWLIGFLFTFTLGGMTGVMMSVPAADFQLHNSLFLVAHFHNTIIGGVVFGFFAGIAYWFPKVFGFKLNEFLGKCAFFSWLIGFFVAFMPIYILGIMGATRRSYDYANSDWQIYFVIAFIGTLIIGLGVVFQVLQFAVSIMKRKEYRVGGDPWDARTLEWSIPSPAPFYNFAHDPKVDELDDFWYKKQNNQLNNSTEYHDIHMPKNTSVPFIMGVLSGVMGFALIFHINWLAIIAVIAIIATFIARSFDFNTDYYVKADEVKLIEEKLKDEVR